MLPKDVVVNVIIPKVVEEKNREIRELKKQNESLKRIIHDGFMQNFVTDIQCSTCDKHFVIIGNDYESYDNPINVLNETTKYIYLNCGTCTHFYCMNCIFDTPIEIRLTHLYCPLCKVNNNCNAELAHYTY